MKNKRIRRTKINMKKVILCLMVIVLTVIGLIAIMGNNTTASFVETKYKKFHVSYGETLWEIARIEAANNEYYANKDVRYIVKDIKTINNLQTSELFPGQELIIPSM